MKKKLFFAAIVIGLVLLPSSVLAATYGGGSGTSSDPYLIYTAEQLNTIGLNPGDWAAGINFKLMADIDMSGTSYTIIGNTTTAFAGVFDGNGHSVANVTINQPGINGVGLFGVLGSSALISNLGVTNANIAGQYWVGILCGRNNYGTISQCYTTGTVTGSNQNVGGLCGETWGPITRCYAAATVTGSNQNVGGLVGGNRYTTISQCYAMGAVTGYGYTGGLVGGNELGTITQCYATGTVNSYFGGLCGGNYGGTITACFWDIDTSGVPYDGNATGLTTAQMKTLSTFTDAGWDFSATDGDPADWFLPASSYPRLAWEPYPGSGTEDDPYLIYTAQQMNTIGLYTGDWSKSFKLMADLDMSTYTGTQYNIIGNSTTNFTGTFDGNGHIIRNLTYTGTVEYVGLFGYISNGTIQNVGLENVTLSTTDSFVGGLAGHVVGTVTNCYVQGGSVSGSWAVGGLIGNNESATVADCYATDAVNSTGSFSGGLAGRLWVGSISRCYSTGAVNGASYVGGFAGWNMGVSFTACFWDTQTSSQSVAVSYGPSAGIAGKTTAQMKTLSTFISAGWDFANVWGIGNSQTYPYLRQLTGINPADMNYSGTVDLQDLAILAANWMKGV